MVVVEHPRGCFRTSGVATETLGRCAKSVIAVGDGDGPYGRQMAMAVDKVQKTNTVGASRLYLLAVSLSNAGREYGKTIITC